jgi:hypothetical protein
VMDVLRSGGRGVFVSWAGRFCTWGERAGGELELIDPGKAMSATSANPQRKHALPLNGQKRRWVVRGVAVSRHRAWAPRCAERAAAASHQWLMLVRVHQLVAVRVTHEMRCHRRRGCGPSPPVCQHSRLVSAFGHALHLTPTVRVMATLPAQCGHVGEFQSVGCGHS